MVQPTDAGPLDAKYKWTRASIRLTEQFVVVGWHDDADDERGEAIEYGQSPDEAFGCLWDVSTRIDGLSGCNGDELGGGNECKARLHKRMPVSQESPRLTGSHVFLEGPWMVPISEPEPIVVRAPSKKENYPKNDQSEDRDELDTSEPELGLPEEGHGDDVQE